MFYGYYWFKDIKYRYIPILYTYIYIVLAPVVEGLLKIPNLKCQN